MDDDGIRKLKEDLGKTHPYLEALDYRQFADLATVVISEVMRTMGQFAITKGPERMVLIMIAAATATILSTAPDSGDIVKCVAAGNIIGKFLASEHATRTTEPAPAAEGPWL